MKTTLKIITLLFVSVAVCNYGFSQNRLPAIGNVGIDIQIPLAPLHVNKEILLTKLELTPPPQFGQLLRTAEANFKLSALSSEANVWNPNAPLDFSNTFNGTVSMTVSANHLEDFRLFSIHAESPNMPIVFKTQGNERIRIAPNGFLGIGAESPRAGLHILTNSTPPGGLPASENGLLLGNANNNSYKWIQSYGGALALNPVGNNVGIGTTNPSAKLQVNGTVKAGSPGSNQVLLDLNSERNWQFRQLGSGPGTALELKSIGGGGNKNFFISTTGGVGISTNRIPSGFRLAVDGKVICEEVRVELSQNWPDYVFAPSYELMPLKEVEKTIREKGHLPGMPSAVEIEEKGGIELGEMQRRMMEKIEELTLYMIEVKKENNALRQANEALLHRLDHLEGKSENRDQAH